VPAREERAEEKQNGSSEQNEQQNTKKQNEQQKFEVRRRARFGEKTTW